ncbi:multidrug resistance protein 2 [Stemphylium lycopersici]|nr:multidrug resistance protein 2 [Stemphylium lycopersici]RAR00557.1 multidrug resistance protein 2 [Stemphylium lycopersici]
MSVSGINAEETENFEDIEKQFAVKVVQHMETYWKILEKVPGSKLRLTKIDDEIYEHLKKEFPEFDASATLNEDEMKSKQGKERWRKFISEYEKKVEDYNFGTMLRASPKTEYSQDGTIFAVRMQFYAIEIARPFQHAYISDIGDRTNDFGCKASNELAIGYHKLPAAEMASTPTSNGSSEHQQVTTQADEEREYASKVGWRILFGFTTRQHVPVLLGGIATATIAALSMPVFAIIYGLIFGQYTLYGAGEIDSYTLTSNMTKYCIILAGISTGNWIANSSYFFFFLTFSELQAQSARNKVFDTLIKKDMALIAKRLSLRAREQSEKLRFALKYVTTAISSIEAVKCFNGERQELQKFKSTASTAAGLYRRVANFRSMQIGIMQFFTVSVFVQGFWYGNHLVDTGDNNAGDVLTTFWAALIAMSGMTTLMPQLIVLQKGKAAGASLTVLMKQISTSHQRLESQGQTKLARCPGNIKFEKVTFSYPSRAKEVAIRDASLFIPAGETTFVIGKSGSGKSTLGQLLVRFYQPSSGRISLDGVPIEEIDVQWLRQNITLVEQHPVLFNDTIRSNLALGNPGYVLDMQEISDAVKFAMLEPFIEGVPDGLDTDLGMKGESLSGGQKQRLALARAKIRNSPVLILDESTSALDYITRAGVLEAIRGWRKGKTTIIITHDVSQIQPKDFIYLLDNARVVQEGYRKELECQGGAFLTFLDSREEIDNGLSEAEDGEDTEDDADERIAPHDELRIAQRAPMRRPMSSILFGQSVLEPFSGRSREIWVANAPTDRRPVYRPFPHEQGGSRPTIRHSFTEGRDSLKVPFGEPFSFPEILSFKDYGPRPASGLTQQLSRSDSNQRPASFSKESGSRPNSMLSARPVSRISQYPRPLAISESLPERSKTPRKLRKNAKVLSKVASSRRKTSSEKPSTSPDSLSLKDIFGSVWPAIGWRSRAMLLGAFLCAIVHSACTPVFAWVLSQLLSTFQGHTVDNHIARDYALAILGVAAADGLSSYLMFFLSDTVAQEWTLSLKTEAVRRILMQPREFFDKEENSVSRLTETLDHFAEEARNLPGRFACVFLAIILMMMVSISWSMVIAWKLALVALAMGPILFAITKGYNMISSRWERFANEADDKVGQILHETFVNIRTVRCLVLENHFRKKYMEATTEAVNVGMKRAIYSGSLFGLAFTGVIFVVILLFWYGGLLMSRNEYTASEVMECFLVLMLSVNHVSYMAHYMTQINISRDASTRLLHLARLSTDSHELTGTTQIQSVGDIGLYKVNFTYPTRQDVKVLDHVSFSIPRGSCAAIVGSSGSGKSTIASLLLKLYQTDKAQTLSSEPVGTMSVSNHDIATLHTTTLRSRMAIVSQTPVLFPCTIAENIAYGLSPSLAEASTESIRAAATAAGISEFIDSLPHGYNTLIGEGGTSLSGGQAQRLSIARALVRNPDVLILDEATSALDIASAGIIRDTILRLVRPNHITTKTLTEPPSSPRSPSLAPRSPPLSPRSHRSAGFWDDKDWDVKVVREQQRQQQQRESSFSYLTASTLVPLDKGKEPLKQMTVIIITHAREMMAIAEHVVMLEQGRVVEQGGFYELKRKKGGAFAKLLRGERA